MIELYGLKIIDDLQFLELKGLLSAHLPDASAKKSVQFKFQSDSQRQILGELMVRAVLCNHYHLNNELISFLYTDKKKPYLKNIDHIHFNITHSGDWVVCAFSNKPVGVDVEKVRKINLNIARRFFSEKETAILFSLPHKQQFEFFFDLWTLKESYLKALGTGLTKSLSSFTVEFSDNGIILMDGEEQIDVNLKQVKLDRIHKLSICGFEVDFPHELKRLYIDDLLCMIQS